MEMAKGISPWPRAIISTFIVLAIGNAVILYLALQSRNAPFDPRPYESGLEYEQVIQQKNAALRAGVGVSFSFNGDGVEAKAEALPGLQTWQARLRLIRPDNGALDRTLHLEGTGPVFQFSAPDIKGGLWLVQLTLSSAETKYFAESRIFNDVAGRT